MYCPMASFLCFHLPCSFCLPSSPSYQHQLFYTCRQTSRPSSSMPGLHRGTDDKVVFWPLPVCSNMLVTAISFPISALLSCHFSPWSFVNSRVRLLNYYSGLYNGVDSRNILPLYFFFDNWVWFLRVWSGIANTSWLYYINPEGILPKKWIQY